VIVIFEQHARQSIAYHLVAAALVRFSCFQPAKTTTCLLPSFGSFNSY
jgi:hypothetical protein